jgi:alpha-tubulin suppressor-like RCC1 family protein
MTEINKQSLVNQINAIIAALNLTTDETERLTLFYKTAINAGEFPSGLNAGIVDRIQNASALQELEELLLLAVGASLVSEDRLVTVPSLTALNSLSNISAGSVYFVEEENIPYIRKSNGTWVRIDPSLQPIKIENAYAWGRNTGFFNTAAGQLGDNTTVNKSSPVSVSGGFTDWVQMSAGGYHSLAVRANGTLWAWGLNSGGQLGDNTIVSKSSPVSVAGGFTDWIQVSGGLAHSLGVRANGTLWAWGDNAQGLLGDNTIVSRSSPVSVAGGFTNWVQVSGGRFHSLGVRANGTLWAWGNNGSGRLGDNTVVSKSSPVSVVGGFTDWIQASAGVNHSLAVRANGTLWAWGSNGSGQLGDNTIASKNSPVSVVGGFTDWVQASAGYHSLGVRANGTLWAWGLNSGGQLGDNTTVSKRSPVSVVGGFTDWVQASASNHNLGVRSNGTLWAWGFNSTGELGDNAIITRSSPVSVVGGFTDWVQASCGYNHSLGIRGG